ncbi:acyltransferase [Cellulomonas fimi]|uniref:acyltransferase family protein n=1 Tax=Cellulomonas fimi TaxID=1708 RepID=UPI001B85F098|nr:acyltransferase [Cellulomonas fimi]
MTSATAQEGAEVRPVSQPPRSHSWLGWRPAGRPLDPRNNALNLVRLALASLVLVAHAYYIAGVGVGPQIDGENLGGWAVFGFFTISGYLITGSRLDNPVGTYFVHRVARIFPAFLVCLIVTALVFAPIGYWSVHGSLEGYLTTGTTPAAYVFGNAGLRVNAYDVAATPAGVPYPGAWNGSLWTLYYEFLSYVIIGALAVLGWFRRSPWPLAGAFALSVAVHALMDRLLPYVGGNVDFQLLGKLLPLFLGGALVHVLRDRLPLHLPGALASTAVVAFTVWALDGWGAQLTAPLIAYVLLWIGATLPSPRLVQRHDISYGVYIYAFPVQQLLVLAGVHELGLAVYDVAAFAVTAVLATASWLLVERPVMRRARGRRETPVATDRVPPREAAAVA